MPAFNFPIVLLNPINVAGLPVAILSSFSKGIPDFLDVIYNLFRYRSMCTRKRAFVINQSPVFKVYFVSVENKFTTTADSRHRIGDDDHPIVNRAGSRSQPNDVEVHMQAVNDDRTIMRTVNRSRKGSGRRRIAQNIILLWQHLHQQQLLLLQLYQHKFPVSYWTLLGAASVLIVIPNIIAVSTSPHGSQQFGVAP